MQDKYLQIHRFEINAFDVLLFTIKDDVADRHQSTVLFEAPLNFLQSFLSKKIQDRFEYINGLKEFPGMAKGTYPRKMEALR